GVAVVTPAPCAVLRLVHWTGSLGFRGVAKPRVTCRGGWRFPRSGRALTVSHCQQREPYRLSQTSDAPLDFLTVVTPKSLSAFLCLRHYCSSCPPDGRGTHRSKPTERCP